METARRMVLRLHVTRRPFRSGRVRCENTVPLWACESKTSQIQCWFAISGLVGLVVRENECVACRMSVL